MIFREKVDRYTEVLLYFTCYHSVRGKGIQPMNKYIISDS